MRYWNGDIPWVSPKDMKRARLHDSSDHISKEALAGGARLAPQGALLMVVRGMILSHSFPVGRAERSLAFNQDIKALVPDTSVDSEFLLWWLQTHRNKFLSITNESTHGTKRIPSEALFAEEVNLPPLPEQRAIVTALSDVDALIDSLDTLIAKKRAIKTATMQQLLTGRRRLPGFGGEWEYGNLATVVAELDAGVSVNSVEGDEGGSGGIYILKTSAVAGGRFIPSECKRIAPRDLSRARLNPTKGTIVVSRMNTPDLVGECGYVDRDYPHLFLPDRLWMTRFKHDSNVSGLWLSYLLSTAALKRLIGTAATGTSGSMKNLSRRAFLQIPIPLPSDREQRAIATVLSDIDAEIAALETRLEKTRQIKQGMMQELLTGRTRLVAPETEPARMVAESSESYG